MNSEQYLYSLAKQIAKDLKFVDSTVKKGIGDLVCNTQFDRKLIITKKGCRLKVFTNTVLLSQ